MDFNADVDGTLAEEASKYFNQIASNYFTAMFTQSYADEGETIQSCFQSIRSIYKRCLGGQGPRPDWSDDHYRATFMYRYFTLHCYMVYRSLQKSSDELKKMWRYKCSFRACCVGGGPGSDAIGLTKFLTDDTAAIFFNSASRLDCTVLDLYPEWEQNWTQLSTANPDERFPRMSYFSGDLTRTDSGLTYGERCAVRSADIVTFVKSFSTIVAFIRGDDSKGNLLEEIFKEMKSGAVVLYVDNWYGCQTEEFKKLASAGGVTETLFELDGSVRQPGIEKSESVRRIEGETNFEPLSSCAVSIMLLKKP